MGQGGRRDPSEYVTITSEVFFDTELGRTGVRPCAGERFPQSMKIECAKEIRTYPLGTLVRLSVVETNKEGGRPFLYSSYKWRHQIVKK